MMIAQTSSISDESQPIPTSHGGTFRFRKPNTRPRIELSKQENDWYEAVESRLEELVVVLRHGWDGYQGRPVGFSNAVFALSMLNSICLPDTPAPQIVPGSNGDLQIEWHTEDADIELAVRGPYDVYAWRSVVGGDADGESLHLTRDFAEIANWVATISEQQGVASISAA